MRYYKLNEPIPWREFTNIQDLKNFAEELAMHGYVLIVDGDRKAVIPSVG